MPATLAVVNTGCEGCNIPPGSCTCTIEGQSAKTDCKNEKICLDKGGEWKPAPKFVDDGVNNLVEQVEDLGGFAITLSSSSEPGVWIFELGNPGLNKRAMLRWTAVSGDEGNATVELDGKPLSSPVTIYLSSVPDVFKRLLANVAISNEGLNVLRHLRAGIPVEEIGRKFGHDGDPLLSFFAGLSAVGGKLDLTFAWENNQVTMLVSEPSVANMDNGCSAEFAAMHFSGGSSVIARGSLHLHGTFAIRKQEEAATNSYLDALFAALDFQPLITAADQFRALPILTKGDLKKLP